RLHPLHLCRDAGVVAGGGKGWHDRLEEGHGHDQGRRLGYGDRQARVRRQGRHQAARLRRVQMGCQGRLHRDQSQRLLIRGPDLTHRKLVQRPGSPGRFALPDHDAAFTARDAIATSVARTSSAGRNGFRKQTTPESSGNSATKSSVVMPDIATIGKPGTRSRILAMTSRPLVPPRKMSMTATSNAAPSNSFSPAASVATPTTSK